MSDAIRATIDEMTKKLEEVLQEAAELRRTINTLSRQLGEEPPYADAADVPNARTTRKAVSIRPDQFFGKSPISAAREYLEQRNEPSTAEEILDALRRGGFEFEAQGWTDEKNRLRNLAISLGKNTAIFTRLPSGPFGLAKWYPGRQKKGKVAKNDASSSDAGKPETGDESGAESEKGT